MISKEEIDDEPKRESYNYNKDSGYQNNIV